MVSTEKDVSERTDMKALKTEADGSWKRAESSFRDRIEKGGKFEPEKDRYHLYVALSCPWATRTLITRNLKGLQDIVPVTVVSPRLGKEGWPFGSVDPFPGAQPDPLYGSKHIKDLYHQANPDYQGRYTVPVLWDKKLKTIVNNESSEIIRVLNSAFNEFLPEDIGGIDIYPQAHRKEIDEMNEWVYKMVNNGVYRAGFSSSQEAYEAAATDVFEGLDRLEKILSDGREFLIGGQLTEADIRAWVTAVRFDVAYHGHFKCNLRDIRHGYPHINEWMKKLYWTNESFKEATNFEHIKITYYWAQVNVNPTQIVPLGPVPPIEPLTHH